MKSTIILFLICLAACGTAQSASMNLVANGSFEEGTLGIGSFEDWQTTLGDATTFVDSSGQTGPHYGQASDGLWAAYFGSTAADGGASISQTFSTTPNEAYVLSFDLANDNAGLPAANIFVASLDGAPVLSFSNLANQGFLTEQFSFVASGSSTLLEFEGSNDASFVELDNVIVSAAAPEPSAYALGIVGMLTLGLLARSRARKSRING